MKPIYVIGHKNPDVDSVAAAIAYAEYKQLTDNGTYIPGAAGDLRQEINFILDYLGLEPPAIIRSVGTTVEDLLEEDELIHVQADMNLIELGTMVREHKLKTVPVLDEQGGFLGLLTIGDVAMIFMNELGTTDNIENSPHILRDILQRRVADIMKTRDLVLFEKDEPLDEVRNQMLASRFRNYPVVDEKNRFLGLISRYNLLKMKRKQLILVDHNEKNQAVDGIEEAEIIEIIDHHRVGDLQTLSPIYFRNEPVGSTSTLVAESFLANQVTLSRSLAGLLFSGIITDTMIFKSPTTTSKDRRIAESLGSLAGLKPVDWGRQVFEKSLPGENQSDEELLCEDLKEYVSGETTFAISQIETIDIARISQRRELLLQTMDELCNKKGYAFMCLMVTDIMKEGTELLVAGERHVVAEQAFGQGPLHGSVFLQGIMSRKKQVVPVIYEVLRKEKL
ncbi:MAG: putative manganese-dependent inorganic diphosphatase [Syntrophomonadaceae bacterium]|nr:putative manganese-dependent inorganic diphosphatase [Syntrophomonadaceae bacterium]